MLCRIIFTVLICMVLLAGPVFAEGLENNIRKSLEPAEPEVTFGPEEVAAILAELANPTIPEVKEDVTHIACIGDSITFGSGVWSNEISKEHTYPAYLERMMGEGYQTLNYGACGCTVLQGGDEPYTSHYMYDESINANAEIYIIMIGSNDSKPYNWNAGNFKSELKGLVQTYIDLENSPAVYLATPPRVYEEGEIGFNLRNSIIEREIAPIVRKVAEETSVTLVDMYEETKDHPEWFQDGAHPNAAGNEEIAKIFAEHVSPIASDSGAQRGEQQGEQSLTDTDLSR